jgi:hypothetical protein
MMNGKWRKAVSIHHLPLTVDRFPLAFARPSHYHVTLPVFVRKSVQKRQILEHFFITGQTGAFPHKSEAPAEENDSCLAINFAEAKRKSPDLAGSEARA